MLPKTEEEEKKKWEGRGWRKRAEEKCTVTKKFELFPALIINWLVQLEGGLLVSCNLLGSSPLDSKLPRHRSKVCFSVAPFPLVLFGFLTWEGGL